MKQQILSSHIPLCHRHMVIATTLLGGRGGYSKVNMQFCNMAGTLFTKHVNNIFSWCSLCATWKQKSVEWFRGRLECLSRECRGGGGQNIQTMDVVALATSLQMASLQHAM